MSYPHIPRPDSIDYQAVMIDGSIETVSIPQGAKGHHYDPAHGHILTDQERRRFKPLDGMRALPDGSVIGGPGHLEELAPDA